MILAATGFMTACTALNTPEPDTPVLPDVFSTDTETPLPPVNWWQSFDDAELDRRVEIALGGNYSLQAAAARVRQSLALLGSARSDYYPTLDATVGRERNWNGDDSVANSWSAGLSTRYELDLWGNIRAVAQQSEFTLAASGAAYRVLANTVAGQITSSWLGLRIENENLQHR